VTIPNTLAAGTYYIGAIADSNSSINESSEANNALAGNTITVTKPDLTVTVLSGPTSGTRGASITITNTVANQGAGNAAGFYVYFYLSTDATVTTSDTYLGNRYVTSLAAGATSNASTVVTIPSTLAVGTYYIGAIVDSTNALTETNETNNALAGNTITVN
jgi:subtilase family serine protease